MCIAIAVAGILLSPVIPNVGSVTLALVLGIVVGNFIKKRDNFEKGISLTDKKILPFTIGLLGVELQPRIILSLGIPTLVYVIILMAVTILVSVGISRLFGMSDKWGCCSEAEMPCAAQVQ